MDQVNASRLLCDAVRFDTMVRDVAYSTVAAIGRGGCLEVAVPLERGARVMLCARGSVVDVSDAHGKAYEVKIDRDRPSDQERYVWVSDSELRIVP
jgi:hypothetical protein